MKTKLLAALVAVSLPSLALAQQPVRSLYPEEREAQEKAAAQSTDAPAAPAPAPQVMSLSSRKANDQLWADRARFFVGARGGVGVPPGGDGVAPTAGIELGVAADSGFGLGLHLLSAFNPPDAPSLGIKKAQWAIGAAADARWYFQTVKPLSLYPTLSAGFLAGPGLDGKNVVLPMLNPGFGARVRVGGMYASLEFGVLGFQVPFLAIAVGAEPDRKPDAS